MKICNYFKNMVEEHISQNFRLKNIDETRINQNEFISKKYKKVITTLKYIEHLLILASTLLVVFPFLLLFPWLVFLWELRILQ